MRRILTRYARDFFHLLFPKICLGCEQSLLHHENFLCLNCLSNLPFTDFFEYRYNKTYQSIRVEHLIEYGFSLLYFRKKGIVQHIMHQLKYKNQKDMGILLGEILAKKFIQHNFQHTFTTVAGVPMSKAKLRDRGYNQCDYIIKGMRQHLSLKDSSAGLIKKQTTMSQTTKHRFERYKNQEELYEICPALFEKNEHILIVDDIITTGATINLLIEKIRYDYPKIKISVASIGITMD